MPEHPDLFSLFPGKLFNGLGLGNPNRTFLNRCRGFVVGVCRVDYRELSKHSLSIVCFVLRHRLPLKEKPQMTVRKKILVIDDDKEACNYIEDLLSFRFSLLKAHCASSGLAEATTNRPDLILLDVKLQQAEGLDVCRSLREDSRTRHIPVLMYSGSDDPGHVLTAFDNGADDYIDKSVRPRELVARILSKIRRIEEQEQSQEVMSCGNLVLNTRKLEARLDDRALALSVLEFNLLRFFVTNKDQVMSRQQILDGVWKDAVVSNRTIDTHMVYLRKKLNGFNHTLATIYGAGYILKEVMAMDWKKSIGDDVTTTT
jgi:DNA-binding response OmpR family regulator